MKTGTPLTVLLVEDDPVTRDLITLVLEGRPEFILISAEDGEQALQAFAEYKPDILLLDILLPVMNGLEVLQRLKDGDRLGDTYVIVTSALGYQEIIQKALASGAKDFVVKPFDIKFLLSRLQHVLESRA